jgi:hypothetical protein
MRASVKFVSAKADGGSKEPFPLSRPAEAIGATDGFVRSRRKEAWYAHPRIDYYLMGPRDSSSSLRNEAPCERSWSKLGVKPPPATMPKLALLSNRGKR